MNTPVVFLAVLLHDDPTRDYVIEVPSFGSDPPNRLRLPTSFAGAAAFDVYELVDPSEWPNEAVFRHVELVPRTTPDLPGYGKSGWQAWRHRAV